MRLAALLLAAPLLLAAAPAHADEPIDTVHLRNGSFFNGRVTEIVPNDHVTIVSADGASQRVAWSEIDRVVVTSSPPPNGAAPAAPAGPPPMVGDKARVHIASPTRVVLYRRPAGATSWSEVCDSPCDKDLPIGDTYHVVGNGVPSSKHFGLGTTPGATVTVVVDPPSTAGMGIGIALMSVGGVVGYFGLLASSASRNDDDRTRGLAAFGAGTAALVGGLILFFMSKGTGIELTSTTRSKDAFLREPLWRNATTGMPGATYPALWTHAF